MQPAKAAKADDQQESAEHQKQRTLCENHKKAAFDTTRIMFEEELASFRAATTDDVTSFSFTRTCIQQNFFSCILEQLSELTRNSARTRVV